MYMYTYEKMGLKKEKRSDRKLSDRYEARDTRNRFKEIPFIVVRGKRTLRWHSRWCTDWQVHGRPLRAVFSSASPRPARGSYSLCKCLWTRQSRSSGVKIGDDINQGWAGSHHLHNQRISIETVPSRFRMNRQIRSYIANL